MANISGLIKQNFKLFLITKDIVARLIFYFFLLLLKVIKIASELKQLLNITSTCMDKDSKQTNSKPSEKKVEKVEPKKISEESVAHGSEPDKSDSVRETEPDSSEQNEDLVALKCKVKRSSACTNLQGYTSKENENNKKQ